MYTKATILALAALATAAPVAEDNIAKIAVRGSKYQPNADGSVNFPLLYEHVSNTLSKYKAHSLAAEFRSGVKNIIATRAVGNLPLTDQVQQGEDELYYGTGTVGTSSPQDFTFDFDTGSSDTFVPGPQCGTTQGCTGTTKYNQKGVDEHNTTSVVYGSGTVMGENYFDQMCVAGLCASHTNIISLTTATGFSGSAAAGLVGMAFQSIANSGQPPFFKNLVSQGKTTQPEFAFYLGRSKSNTQGASEMTLGGVDSSKFNGPQTLVPVTNQTYWQVALDNTAVNGKSAGAITKGQAAIDTGTTIILAPTAAAAAIYQQIPGSVPLPLISGSPAFTFFGYPCNSNPKVAITFAGKQFIINPLDFNFGTLSDGLGLPIDTGLCLGGIAGGDISPTQNLYVVGDTFLKNWYSTYSYVSAGGKPGVSFARATGNQ